VLLSGCAVRFVFSYLAEGFITLCTEAGYEVVIPKGEFCCGAPLLSMGMLKESTRLAQKNIQYLGALKADITVSLCPTCTHTMRNVYLELTGQSIEIEDSAFVLLRILQTHKLKKLKGLVLYHHPCHSLYGLGIKREPLELIGRTGLTVTELPEGCCGFAGVFSVRFKDLSANLLQQRFAGINKEAATVVTACPGCIFQFMKVLPQGRVMHIVEVIEEAMDEQGRQEGTSG
jgi:Fe-S oxidoreductase